MGRRSSLGIVAILVALASVSCGGDKATPEKSTPRSTADVIRDTERTRIRALVAGDIERARALHADEFLLTTPVGDKLTKERYLDAVHSGRLDYVTWDPVSPIRVRVQGDRAVVRYRSKIGFAGNYGGTTEQSHLDTYERRGGLWQIVRSVTR